MKINVLFVIPALKSGGVEKSLISLLKNLDYDKFAVDLYAFSWEGMFIDSIPKEVEIINNTRFSLWNLLKKGKIIKACRYLAAVVQNNDAIDLSTHHKKYWRQMKFVYPRLKKDYDVAISYNDGYSLYYVVDNIKAKRKIAWNHINYKTDFCCKPKMDCRYYEQVDHVVTVSEECAVALKEYFCDLDSKIIVIENITDAKSIREKSILFNPYKDCGFDIFKFVSVGRLSYQKGFDLAIGALKIVKERGYRFKWYIIGIGTLETELKKMVERANIKDEVVFLHEKPNPYPFIKFADVYVQTSRAEGKSIAIEEAKILCKPILVTNYLNAKEQIIDGQTGIICDLECTDIADKMIMMIENADILDRLSLNLRKKDYSNKEVMLKRFYNLLWEDV